MNIENSLKELGLSNHNIGTSTGSNYFSDGEIWTNNWFTWNGTGNATGLRYSNKAHFDFKWENGVVVELQCYFDPTGLNMELAAQ